MLTTLSRTIILTVFFSVFFINLTSAHSHHETSSIGNPVKATKASKTIKVTASDDMRFNFLQNPQLHDGEIIRFEVTNIGKVVHEFSIGDEKEQKEHQKMMRTMPGMVHEDGNTITINPGETKTLTWQFKANPKHDVVFACNIPGHFEAGMYMKVKTTKLDKNAVVIGIRGTVS
ncbi:TPA: cupredoxin domain-containing protein [Legionella anisa]